MRNLLVVDDDLVSLHAIAIFLESEGYDIKTANNGNEAIEILQLGTFDLVLSDITMPYGSGFDLLNYVRATTPELPVLLMSGLIEIDCDEIKSRGAVNFLAKPVDFDDMLAKIVLALTL